MWCRAHQRLQEQRTDLEQSQPHGRQLEHGGRKERQSNFYRGAREVRKGNGERCRRREERRWKGLESCAQGALASRLQSQVTLGKLLISPAFLSLTLTLPSCSVGTVAWVEEQGFLA